MTGVRVVPADTLADEERITALGEPDQPEDVTPGSLMDRLRSRAREVARERTLDLPVPGWRGELVLRFRPLDVGQLERFVEARSAGRASGVSEAIDALATCCVGVLARDGDTLVPLADPAGPVLIEHRLGVLLGQPVPPEATLTVREVVLGLFGGNAFALGAYVDRMVEWMGDPDAAAQPGES